ncbi:hypothetical protein F5883DRAFT_583015 [Diaporthe sp. PMI_573]|nr:hypothetical protein F5883DRAFT_583015 [Diaporthaceae sp. PMI_573]
MNGRNTVAKLLVKKGYRLAPKDDKDMTPLHWAANEGHGTIYRLLVKNGVSPNDEDEGGNTAMYYAIKSGVLP